MCNAKRKQQYVSFISRLEKYVKKINNTLVTSFVDKYGIWYALTHTVFFFFIITFHLVQSSKMCSTSRSSVTTLSSHKWNKNITRYRINNNWCLKFDVNSLISTIFSYKEVIMAFFLWEITITCSCEDSSSNYLAYIYHYLLQNYIWCSQVLWTK